jgi:hypothetical protein
MPTRQQNIFAITALIGGTAAYAIGTFQNTANRYKEHWIERGRCYEHFALQATALGIKNPFLNQPIEVTTLRPQFASYLGIGDRRPDLIVRFGYGLETPRSLRRSLNQVIVAST